MHSATAIPNPKGVPTRSPALFDDENVTSTYIITPSNNITLVVSLFKGGSLPFTNYTARSPQKNAPAGCPTQGTTDSSTVCRVIVPRHRAAPSRGRTVS